MSDYRGFLGKMPTNYADTIEYKIPFLEGTVNEYLGKELQIRYTGLIKCQNCGTPTKKSFGEGFCYPCFANAPQAAECIIRPELCQAHEGIGRDVEWEDKHHNQPHVVYLALSSAVKVGVTRSTQVPYRWIDQGASSAIKIAEVPYRQLAGQIEVALKEHFTDKTNWQRMLKNEVIEADLVDEKWELEGLLPMDLAEFMSEDDEIIDLNYPVLQYPEKVKSVNLDKAPIITGTLVGIKGQYLIFEDNRVFNVRRHTSYEVDISI